MKLHEGQIELELLRVLKHPGIITLHEGFQDQQNLYLVLDLCENGDLFSLINSIGSDMSLSLSRDRLARHYLSQLLETMCYMHSQGVIHRDLKPENVVLDSKKNSKVIDFGTCKILNEELIPAAARKRIVETREKSRDGEI